MQRQKLLFLTKENPFLASGGAHIRDAHLIRLLQESMDVEVLCYANSEPTTPPTDIPPGVVITAR